MEGAVKSSVESSVKISVKSVVKLLVISGWNTPSELIEDFCLPVAQKLGLEFELLKFEGSQLSVEEQINVWDVEYKNEPVIIFAWSLGGNLALKWQEQNSNIQSVVTVATNLNFVDEEFGMTKKQFDLFCQGFNHDSPVMNKKMQKKFMQLVLMGSDKDFMSRVKAVYEKRELDVKTLHHSLLWLEKIKLDVKLLGEQNQYWFADKDCLVPKGARLLFEYNQLFEGSHAFFLEAPLTYQSLLVAHFSSVLEIGHG